MRLLRMSIIQQAVNLNRRHQNLTPDIMAQKRRGHLAAGGGWWNPFSSGKGDGHGGRKSPSNSWIRVPEQTVVAHPARYRLTDADLRAIKAGKALCFTGKALAKAALICEKRGRLEILWYWTARRSNPWVIDDLILPDDQYATSGTCYASPEEVLAVSRQARRRGRLIVGAGHSHGYLGVFSSVTDLELMSQLAAERVGFASQVEQTCRGRVTRQPGPPAADEGHPSSQPVSVFEVTFEDNPQAWLTLTAQADLSEDDLDVRLELLQRHQASFFTTHNADGEAYFPVHHVTCCLHCGMRLEDFSSEDVQVHVLGRGELSEEEENDLIAELDRKSPRGGFFRERWGSSHSDTHQPVHVAEPDSQGALAEDDEDDDPDKPADFFVYRHAERVGRVPAAVLEEAAYRCPALAEALGWDADEELNHQTSHETEDEAKVAGQAREDDGREVSEESDQKTDDQAEPPRSPHAGDVPSDPTGGTP